MREKHTIGCIGEDCPHCRRRASGAISDAAWLAIGGTLKRRPDGSKPKVDLGGCALKIKRLGDRDILPGLPDPLGDVADDVRHGWADSPCVQRAHVSALWQLAKTPVATVAAAGDGIVTCGGGKYWPGMVVSLRMTRAVTDLPIQVWYRGDAEPVDAQEVCDLPDITFHDLTKTTPKPRRLEGWEAKAIALLNCGLRHAIFIDADAYFVSDPKPLLDAARLNRIAFWIDVGDKVKWEAFGLSVKDGTHVPPFQGGQFGIDLVAARRELVLLHWLCQHSDYSFKHGYGDQEMLRVALAVTKRSYATLGHAEWTAPGFSCRFGVVDAVSHRVDCKFGIDKDTVSEMAGEAAAQSLWGRVRRGDYKGGAAAVFGRIYEAGGWGAPGSSGQGSDYHEATPYVNVVNHYVATTCWESVVDLGCGDGRVLKRINADRVVGVDCYAPVVRKIAPERGMSLCVLDLDKDRGSLPAGDVALFKDVLMHWPNALIREWLGWAVKCGKWRRMILCNSGHGADGSDCPLGGWRPVDLSALTGLPMKVIGECGDKRIYLLDCE